VSARKGYRVRRLKARRKKRLERGQWLLIYVLAGAVALGAVFGAWFIAKRLMRHETPVNASGSLILLTFGAGERGARPVAGLALFDAARASWRIFTVPREFLLEGQKGEYVMAGDIMGDAALAADLTKLVQAPVTYDLRLPYAALTSIAAGGASPGGARLEVQLGKAATLRIGSAWRTYQGTFSVPVADLPRLLGATGKSGEDEDAMAAALLAAAFHSGALQPAQTQDGVLRGILTAFDDKTTRTAVQQTLAGLLDGHVLVERLPSHGEVSQGQFAFRPDRERIMAEVTRRIPGHSPRYTVIVQNGTGEVGIGELVRQKLSVLDVTLPSPSNADAFDYKRTEILAGTDALTVAEDVRAILGHGVVLRGDSLPATTLVVIVGADLKVKDLQ
jgi:hypothetical protein